MLPYLSVVFTAHLFTSSTPMSHPLYQVSQYTEYILLYILNNPTHPASHIPHALPPLSTTLLTPLCTYHQGDSFLSLLALSFSFKVAQLYTFKLRQILSNSVAQPNINTFPDLILPRVFPFQSVSPFLMTC